MSKPTDAIVLRMHPWSETSLIGSLYTRDFGKVSVVAKGARRPKSPFEAALDLLSVCRVIFIEKSGDSLSLLTEAKLQNRFHHVDRNLIRLYAAYYLAELLDKFTEQGATESGGIPHVGRLNQEERIVDALGSTIPAHASVNASAPSSHSELFELSSDTLRQLEKPNCDVRAIVLRLELQLLRLTGHLPSLRSCVHCGSGIASQRWILYSPVSGGALCSNCSIGGRHLMRVPQVACECVERFSITQWRRIPLDQYPQENRAVLRAIMTKTLASLVGQRLRLQPYIEELGR